MKLVWYEILKLWKTQAVLWLVLLCLCVNLGCQWWEMEQTTAVPYTLEAWNSMLNDISSRDLEETKEWLIREKMWYYFLSLYGSGNGFWTYQWTELQDEYPQIDWEKRLEDWLKEPESYEEVQRMSSLLTDLEDRVSYRLFYPVFLETVQEQAKSLQGIALFSKVEGFSKRNILRTAQVYRQLEGLPLGLDYTEAAVLGTDSLLADSMMLILVLLLGWQILCREKVQGLYPMLRSAKQGKRPLTGAKLGAFGICLTAVSAGMYGTQILLAAGVLGVGNMDIPLQSISVFRNCAFEVTIWEYLWLFLAVKVLGVLTIGSVLSVLMTWKWEFFASALMYFVILAVEYTSYISINPLTPWNVLKFINLFAVLDAQKWFSEYRNLNLFTYSVSVTVGKLMFSVICIAAAMLVAMAAFNRRHKGRRFIGIWKVRRHQPQRIERKRFPVPGTHYHLFLHEGYKLYLLSGAGLLLMFTGIFAWRTAEGIPDYEGTMAEAAYRYYVEELEGVYTEETAQRIRSERLMIYRQDEEALQMQEAYDTGNITEEDYQVWEQQRSLFETYRSAGLQLIEQQEKAILLALQYADNVGFVDENQLAYLLEDDKTQIIYAMMLLTAMIFGTAGLIGMEDRYGLTGLVCSTVRGRRPLQWKNLLQIFLLATLFYLILYVPYYFAVWRDLRRVDADLLLQSAAGYSNLLIPLTIRQAFVWMMIVRYLTALVCGLLTAAVTKAVRHTVMASFICIFYMLVPCFLFRTGINLSLVTCVGGFLLTQMYRNGQIVPYFVYLLAMLTAGCGSAIYILRRN